MEEPPNPPHSGGLTTCPRHPDGPGRNCRACGTTSRQLTAVADRRRRAAERRRPECPQHRGQLADSCRSCAADQKAAS